MSLSPTPWTLDMDAIDRGVDVLAADGGSVCNCFANDANLIAAAPDLLSSVKDLLFIGNLVDEERQNVIARAVAAIKKAEGQS